MSRQHHQGRARLTCFATVLAVAAVSALGASSPSGGGSIFRTQGVALPIPAPSVEPAPPVGPDLGSLEVSPNGRFLQFSDGRPFFYLGDTAWEMFHRASRDDAVQYLDTRAEQGFTVIQAVALAEKDGLGTPTPAGHLPLVDDDPAQPAVADGPDNDYWDDVDFMIDHANSQGMYVGLWVAWGSMVDDGPEVLDESNAEAYGRFVGDRYRDRKVIFVLGGDRDAHAGNNTPEVWGAVAEGIRATDTGKHLISYHPWGEQSSTEMWRNDSPVLDFNMLQSGHKDKPLETLADDLTAVYEMEPVKPVFDGEPRYEEHPVGWDSADGWWVGEDARAVAYSQVFAGGFGHTYGNGAVHQFWEPGMDAPYEVRDSWQDALFHEGATQMRHLRSLMLSRSFVDRIPDQGLVTSGEGRATRSGSGSWAMVYLRAGGTVEIDTSRLAGSTLAVTWFNPRTGETQPGEGTGVSFTAPDGQDWVLVLDAA